MPATSPPASPPPSPDGAPPSSGFLAGIRDGWLLALAWAAAAALGWTYLTRGWIPHDVGTLGHAAERVLAGELPHRDFVDVYTGGQAMLNALGFRLLGVEAMSLRLVFFAAYLLWVPCVWYVARSFAAPLSAMVTTILAAALTLPVYPEGMPSWYNLFLATAGTASLVRYLRTGSRLWVFWAGVAGGVSILFKIVGLYFVAGALLFLLYLETRERTEEPRGSDAVYRVVAAAGCMVLAFAALWVVISGSQPVGILHFAIPPLAAIGVVCLRLTRESGRTSAARFRALARSVLPLAAGVAAPIVVFSVPYATSGSLGALYEGVFVLPRARLDFQASAELPVVGFVSAAALVAWGISRGRVALIAGGAVVLGALAATHVDPVYLFTWRTLISLGPVLSVAAAWSLASKPSRVHGDALLLLLAVFGFANLVQIPYSVAVYFLYAAPLALLLAVPLASSAHSARRMLLVVSGLAAFAVLRVDTGFIRHLGYRYRPHEETEALQIPRARGIRVAPWEIGEVELLVSALGRIDAGPAILAIPDAPEVYFLTGLRNPSNTLFDFNEDPEARMGRVLALIDREGIEAVVLNRRRLFAPLVDGPLLDSLRARFDWSAEIGRFHILWIGPDSLSTTP